MKGLWKKYLGLAAAGLLAASTQAADSEPITVTPPRTVIARAGDTSSDFASSSSNQKTAKPSPPADTASIGRPAGSVTAPERSKFAVTLERPRAAEFAVQRAAFQVPVRPVSRVQSPELIPSPGSVGPPESVPESAGPGIGMPMFPSPTASADGMIMPDGGMATGIDPDRFGMGDGVSHQFNNFITLDAEYLRWKMCGSDAPPLLTNFVPGLAATFNPMVLFGGKSEDSESHSGLRTRLTVWVDRDHKIGIEGSYFFLTEGEMDFARSSMGMPLLAIPFDRTDNTHGAVILANPNDGSRGGVQASMMSRLWGAEANVRGNVLSGENAHLDLIGGFRAMGLDDNFEFAAARSLRGGGFTQATRDTFDSRNRFYGGQIGAEAEWRSGRWSLGVTSKVAFGNTTQQVEIAGGSLQNGIPGAGGLFARPSNSDRFERNRFSVVPEVGVKLGYQLTDCIRANIGYNFLYWSDVARATEQIDPVLVGTGRPAFAFKSADFWAHGLTGGLEFRY